MADMIIYGVEIMNNIDKAKLKVLIKMVLIMKHPDYLKASEIVSFINCYEWGLKTEITSTLISNLLKAELNKGNKHFLEDIDRVKGRGGWYYGIPTLCKK